MPNITPTAWPAGLTFDLALVETSSGEPIYSTEELCRRYAITPQQLTNFNSIPGFRAEVVAAIKEVNDSHGTTRLKAGAQLQMYIDHKIPAWMNEAHEVFPPSEKVKILTLLSKLSGIDAQSEETDKGKNASPSFTLVIQSTNQQKEVVIDGQATKIS